MHNYLTFDPKKYGRDWYQKNKTRLKKRRKELYFQNRDAERAYMKKRHAKLRLRLIHALGFKCNICGCKDLACLVFHHMNFDGKKDRQRFGGKRYMSEMALYYLNHPREAKQKLQLLCANCHIKQHQSHWFDCLLDEDILDQKRIIEELMSIQEKIDWLAAQP